MNNANRVALLLLTAVVATGHASSPCSLKVSIPGDAGAVFSLSPSTVDPWSHAEAFAERHGLNSGAGCASSLCVAGVLVKALANQGCGHVGLEAEHGVVEMDTVGLEVAAVAAFAATSGRANFSALAHAAEASLRTVRREVDASVCFSVRYGGSACATDQTSPASIAVRAYEEQLRQLAEAATEERKWFTAEMHVTELLSLRRHHLEASAALTRQLAELTSNIAARYSEEPLADSGASSSSGRLPTAKPPSPPCVNPEPLDEIGRRTGTDKSSRHHHFLRFYEEQFSKALGGATTDPELTSVLEVGVKEGRSLAMYKEKFPCARVVGLDLEPERSYASAGYEVRFANQSDMATLVAALRPGEKFDVIIDDGGHTMLQQQQTLAAYWARLKPGGVFIIEDLHTSYHGGE